MDRATLVRFGLGDVDMQVDMLCQLEIQLAACIFLLGLPKEKSFDACAMVALHMREALDKMYAELDKQNERKRARAGE